MGLEVGHRALHRFSALQHNRQLHLTRTKQLTDNFHAIKQKGVDDLEGLVVLQAFFQGRLQANSLTINDVLLEPLLDRQISQ